MQYLVNGNLKYNGTRYTSGDIVDISDEVAQPLLNDGVISVAPDTTQTETAPEVPQQDPLVSTPVGSVPVNTVPVQPEAQPQAPAQVQQTSPTPEEIAATIASIDSSTQQPQQPLA